MSISPPVYLRLSALAHVLRSALNHIFLVHLWPAHSEKFTKITATGDLTRLPTGMVKVGEGSVTGVGAEMPSPARTNPIRRLRDKYRDQIERYSSTEASHF